MSYILTGWVDDAEITLRTHDPSIVRQKASQLVAEGWRVSLVRTDTGDVMTVAELQDIDRVTPPSVR